MVKNGDEIVKKVLLFTILIASLMLGACKSTDKPDETSPEVTTTSTEETEETEETTTDTSTEETTTAVETESQEVTTTAEESTGTVTGVVDDATMNTVILKLDDGTTVEFDKEGIEVISDDGLNIDDWVEVTYEGSKAVKIVEVK